MSIYNIIGQDLTVAYNHNGLSVQSACDINGNEVFNAIDVSDVVSFYQQDVIDAVNYIRGLGDNYYSVAVVTDQHYTKNYGYTPQIMKALYRTGVIDKCLFLGDNSNGGSTSLLTAWKNAHKDIIANSFVILGNHEMQSTDLTVDGVYAWEKENVYDVMATPTSWGISDHSYYYYDIAEYKIRLIFCDPNHDSRSQKTWLYNAIDSTSDGWVSFLICHEAPFIYTPVGYDTYSGYRDRTLFGTFEVDYAGNPKLGCVFCGHHHNDVMQVNSGIRQSAFLCDTNLHAGGFNGSMPLPTRSANDNTAQSITILSINPTSKNVKLLRIGQVDNAGGFNWVDKKTEFNYEMTM